MPTAVAFALPSAMTLVNVARWSREPHSEPPWVIYGGEKYVACRLNLVAKERPTGEEGYGEAYAQRLVPPKGKVRDTVTHTLRQERIDLRTALESRLDTQEARTQLESQISKHVLPGLSAEAGVEANFARALKVETSESVSNLLATTTSREISFEFEGDGQRWVQACLFERFEADIWLHHIDFLAVHYRALVPGAAYLRVKRPEIVQPGQVIQNYTKFGQYLGTLRYWRPKAVEQIDLTLAENHAALRINPTHTDFVNGAQKKPIPVSLERFARMPSLYKVSNVAFADNAKRYKNVEDEGDLVERVREADGRDVVTLMGIAPRREKRKK